MRKSDYFESVKRAAELGRDRYEANAEHWRLPYDPDRFLRLYAPPMTVPLQASLESLKERKEGRTDG